jgi:Ser/Thr protein kinase RdoA (MazF antagonist)
LQPCLRDVWHDHVLFCGDEVTGLIDASACRAENVVIDLVRLVGSLAGDESAAWDVALDEYQQARSLSVEEVSLLHVLDRSSVLLTGIRWVERIACEPRLADDERVALRMRSILQRLEHLARTI